MRYFICFALQIVTTGVIAAPVDYHNAISADAPSLHYRLNEASGDAVNYGSLGSAYDGIYNGTPARSTPTAAGDTGVSFAAAADYIASISAAPASLTGNPDFSIETIVRIGAGDFAQHYAPFLGWGAPGTGNSVYFSNRWNDENRIYAGFYNAGRTMTQTVCFDNWYHIAWTRDSNGGSHDSETGTRLFVNGQEMTTVRDPFLSPGFDATLTVTSTPFLINRHTDFTRYHSFDVDEVVLFDRTLSEAEVLAHWHAYADNLGDIDADGVSDDLDNCTTVANASQLDSNGDGFGSLCDPDLNNDFAVNFTDLARIKIAFFSRPGDAAWDPDADFDGTGQVNFADLGIMKERFFGEPGPSSQAFLCGTS